MEACTVGKLVEDLQGLGFSSPETGDVKGHDPAKEVTLFDSHWKVRGAGSIHIGECPVCLMKSSTHLFCKDERHSLCEFCISKLEKKLALYVGGKKKKMMFVKHTTKKLKKSCFQYNSFAKNPGATGKVIIIE
ncbi:helix-hairpin-helix domain-containing protein [Sansalvadorimonas sp. 2012CJ34-2]|uniref:Helix-hairpin-helix domain-containing protein n=1 Tax=Parendozoicomonas callyspongiae TaxID=2942213 RepID=A0ABT0PHW1_9GAMM|nr:helix-hairpin-helix domain-containing protein [Sansalvadorimonas sp. 2012CJ34-2]MCL6270980.1 helix-hairpin-helix domain-containing protein [Sansalvadorimonas sp. 2012CJ34-2]